MNNWKLRYTFDSNEDSDYVEVNGHLANLSNGDFTVDIIPFGNQFAAALRTGATDTFGPVSNQVPGICNGTFTHTGSGVGNVAATTLTGEGSGAFFRYEFLADGTLSTITANTGGTGYKVGDKLRITTSASHGSQVIEFRLVDGSNATQFTVQANHENQSPFPFAVHRARIGQATPKTLYVFDYRSSQVFPKPQDKLLDKYPGAAAAYGLRLLRSAYLGPAIRVSRSSDSAEKDIYFDSQGNLDITALKAHVGASLGRVKTWYDQSGNGKDATQSATSQRPYITSASGELITVNGKPALTFDGSNDSFNINTGLLYGQARFDAYFHIKSDDTKYLMFSQGTAEGNHSFAVLDGSDSTSVASGYIYSTTNMYVNGVDMNYVSGTSTRDDIYTAFIENGAEHSNGAIIVHENAQTNNWTNFKVSAYSDYQFDGKMTEMLLYNTDQSANRENIEKDMALYSGAYQVEDAPLLDAYGGAHAAYSLRKLNSDYTGAAIRIRRQGDHTEADIGFDSNGNLDEAAVLAHGNGTACYVKTWYDQSGNGNDATQSTNTQQPIILYSQQTLPKIDGRVALRFDGNDNAIPFDSTGLDIGNLSSFLVSKLSSTSGTHRPLTLSGPASNNRWYAPQVGSDNFVFNCGNESVSTSANTNNNLHTMIAGATQGDAEAFINGTSVGTMTLDSGIDPATTGIGGISNAFLNGFIQEVVVYSSDQSERRLGIERNISNHYDL